MCAIKLQNIEHVLKPKDKTNNVLHHLFICPCKYYNFVPIPQELLFCIVHLEVRMLITQLPPWYIFVFSSLCMPSQLHSDIKKQGKKQEVQLS
jgi:hypothetical protein